jgi:hypothetical protein
MSNMGKRLIATIFADLGLRDGSTTYTPAEAARKIGYAGAAAETQGTKKGRRV